MVLSRNDDGSGREEQSVLGGGLLQPGVRPHPGWTTATCSPGSRPQDAVHPLERDDDAAVDGVRGTGQSGPRPLRDDRYPVGARDAQDRGDLGRGGVGRTTASGTPAGQNRAWS